LSALLALPTIQAFSFPRSHPSRFNKDATLDGVRRSAPGGQVVARSPQGPYSNPGEFIGPGLSRVNPNNKPPPGYGAAPPPHGTGVPPPPHGTGVPPPSKGTGSPPYGTGYYPPHGTGYPPHGTGYYPPYGTGYPPHGTGSPSHPVHPGRPISTGSPAKIHHSPIKVEKLAYIHGKLEEETVVIADYKGDEHIAMFYPKGVHHHHHHHPSGTGYGDGGGYPQPTGGHDGGHGDGGYGGPTGTGRMPHPTGGWYVREGFTGPKMGRPKMAKEEEEAVGMKEKKGWGSWGSGWLSGLI